MFLLHKGGYSSSVLYYKIVLILKQVYHCFDNLLLQHSTWFHVLLSMLVL